jgi:uncharacterized Zn-binding protein involved in type VI secretion
MDREASALVPDRRESQPAAVTGALTLQPHIYKGSTSDEQGTSLRAVPEVPVGGEPAAGP